MELVNAIDWTKPTWDLFIVLFFVVAALLYGISFGRERILSSVIAIYMAVAVVKSAPAEINIPNFPAIQISTFIGIIVVVMFLLSRSAVQRSLASSDQRGSLVQTAVFSILHIGLVISVVLTLLPKEALDKLAPLTRTIFVENGISFAWILAPILAMMLLGGKKKERKYKYDL